MLPNRKRILSAVLLGVCLISQACTLDKRIEFASADKIGLEAGSKPCVSNPGFTRWFAFYGLWRLPFSEPELAKKEGKVYFAEHGVNWWQGALNLVTGFFSSIVFYRVNVTECDLGTRFVHKDDYEKFFEDERDKARQEFFAKTEKDLEEGLRRYLEKTHAGENSGKNYSTIIYRTGRVFEARVVGQDTESIRVETEDDNGQKHESTIPKKEIYKVVFATKVIKVKDTGKDK
ncbi:hypothetical protein ACE5IS_14885 [Leptospira wolffii]|uniref:Lipoprotein n=1 Tax=Leptospira wolffii TaxID=409998 RepID=A0ABV5BRD7_9LEPT|nr:hypothetical protein [Leptospira wolffii]EPG67481.1 putative lipoprotein [Leptospira wolffii serovar Khorat str. Khorat-H2]TGL45420.1 hypothetical protein EHQ61_19340 [Leptospira wolffii]